MGEHFADRLLAAVDEKAAPVCVGIDPVFERLPETLRAGRASRLEAVEAFCNEVLEIVSPIAPAVKPQSAYFEQLGPQGVALYFRVIAEARRRGLIVIGDAKRGDIGATAEAYAAAHLAADEAPDAVTVNGYFGADGINPFVRTAAGTGRGVFVLVRTSNPSAATVQDFADAAGKKLYEHVAEAVSAIGGGEGLIGRSGYSCVGAVVGATWPEEAGRLRQAMPQQLFLVPGYGAQGASAADCTAAFKTNGTGAIVNASRSVIYAYQDEPQAGTDWRQAVEAAARAFARDIAGALAPRSQPEQQPG